MPAIVTLNNPLQSIQLDKARICAITLESNPARGTNWVDVYVVLGRENGDWEQHVDPRDGAIAHLYRIANGMNPTARPAHYGDGPSDGPALGKCDACGVWMPRGFGACEEQGCGGTIEPYDGFSRLLASSTSGLGETFLAVVRNSVYQFLLTEQVPDPADWQVKTLLDASA